MQAPRRASIRVYDGVREEILSGSVRGGELLSEVEVAARFGVSRTPVHEAFLRLEAEELLRLESRRGAVVVPVSPQEARDVLEVRQALEVAAARRLASDDAATRAARESLRAEVVGLLEEQERLARAGDVAGFAVADEAFHRAIVRASGNAVALGVYRSMADRQRRMTIGAVAGRPEHLATLVGEHAGLADLVDTAAPDAFERALARHLHATHSLLTGLPTVVSEPEGER